MKVFISSFVRVFVLFACVSQAVLFGVEMTRFAPLGEDLTQNYKDLYLLVQ